MAMVRPYGGLKMESDIKYQIDSTGVDFQSIYLNAQRINSGHE